MLQSLAGLLTDIRQGVRRLRRDPAFALSAIAIVALGRFVGALLYGVEPNDPATFAAATFLVGVVSLAASWLPARRAARVAPLAALRQD